MYIAGVTRVRISACTPCHSTLRNKRVRDIFIEFVTFGFVTYCRCYACAHQCMHTVSLNIAQQKSSWYIHRVRDIWICDKLQVLRVCASVHAHCVARREVVAARNLRSVRCVSRTLSSTCIWVTNLIMYMSHAVSREAVAARNLRSVRCVSRTLLSTCEMWVTNLIMYMSHAVPREVVAARNLRSVRCVSRTLSSTCEIWVTNLIIYMSHAVPREVDAARNLRSVRCVSRTLSSTCIWVTTSTCEIWFTNLIMYCQLCGTNLQLQL